VFRRRRAADDDELDELDEFDDEATDDEALDGADAPAPGRAGAVTTGPWDEADAPDDELPRVDLGTLRVPVPPGVEMRVDMQDQTVVAVTLVDGASSMQVHAFAAPKSSGIWADVRDEIAASLREGGASPETAEGPFGDELFARVAVQAAPGATAPTGQVQPLRFLGVDGPRWFLRGLLTGPAATDPTQSRRLLDAFRRIVVVRGGEAMAPREVLPLRLPREALAQAPEPEPARSRHSLEMLERGPEITETR
jgi:hypothetical protein